MREFNSRDVSVMIGKNYNRDFPDKKGKITVFSHGIRTDNSSERILNAFYCYNHNNGCIGWAIHLNSTKTLRFYNHVGDDIGLEINMVYKPMNKPDMKTYKPKRTKKKR